MEPAAEVAPAGPTPRRAGGAHTNALSLDDVIEAALAITRRAGLSAVTVRAVADELGVTGPALYYHVPGGKQSLVDLVVDRVTTTNQPPDDVRPGETWIDRLERQVLSVAAVEHEYPGVMPYVMSAGRDLPTYIDSSEQALRVLIDAGFSAEEGAGALAAITSHVIGWTAYQPPSAGAARASGHGDLAEAVDYIAETDPADILRVGLRSLLEGLEVTRRRRRQHA